MSINTRRLASGRIVYDVRLRDPSGRHYKRTFRSKKEAEAFDAGERTSQSTGTWVDPREGKVVLDEYASTWLKTRVGLRPRTRDLYELTLRLHILPTFGRKEIASITSAMVRAWYAGLFEKGLAQSTCAKAYRLLRTILSTAVEDGVIVKNPCTIKGAGVARSPERPIASVEEVMALADVIDERYRLAVFLGTFAGLRLGELLALTRERVDLEEKTVRVVEQLQELADGGYIVGPPKSAAGRRVIALPGFMVAEIARHLEVHAGPGQRGLLFSGAEGGPLRRAVLHRAWDAARKKVGLPHLHFHDLRHTGNTLAAATGASTRELMARMGHASAEAALRYQHATRRRDVTIAEALDAMVEGSRQAPSEAAPESEPAATPASTPAALVDNVTSISKARSKRRQGARARGTQNGTRHERAMVEGTGTDGADGDASDQGIDQSGRRESNPRSQLGKLMFCR
jgi:integrase